MKRIALTADIIRDRRVALDWTQAELANAVGVHINSIYGWESASYLPSPANQRKLRELFKMKDVAPETRLDKMEATLRRIENLLREQYGKNN